MNDKTATSELSIGDLVELLRNRVLNHPLASRLRHGRMLRSEVLQALNEIDRLIKTPIVPQGMRETEISARYWEEGE